MENNKIEQNILNEEVVVETVTKKQYDELNDKYKRAIADYQNLKRRTETYKTNMLFEMKKHVMNQFLPILDDLDLAANEIKDPSLFMIFRKSLVMLSENQVIQFGQEGDIFDDKYHNAILTEYDSDKEEGVILKVQKRGYKLGEQIIRYADVVVNKKQE